MSYNEIESATVNGSPLSVYDDCGDNLYLYGQEFGPTLLIQADSESSAYGIAIDESKTIEPDDLVEAYGFYLMQACHWNEKTSNARWYVLSDHEEHGDTVSAETLVCEGDRRSIGNYETKAQAVSACAAYVGENEIDLVEGYQYQDNATDTGIVNVGHYEWLRCLTAAEMKTEFDIEIQFATALYPIEDD